MTTFGYCGDKILIGLRLAMLGATLLMFASPATAARLTVGTISADLPKGWQASQEAEMIIFSSAKADCHVSFFESTIEAGDPQEAAQARASLTGSATFGPAGHGFAFEGDRDRYWFAASGGSQVEVGAAGCPAAANVLKSLRPGADASTDTRKMLGWLQGQKILDWLAFRSAPFDLKPLALPTTDSKPMPDFSNYGDESLERETPIGIVADLPDGWRRTTAAAWTAFVSPDGKTWLAARIYHLPEGDDFDAYLAFTRKLADKLGGRNISSGEGMVSFETGEGYLGNTALYGDKCLLTIAGDESDEISILASSISPSEE
jgi:hypothetical protein